MATTLAMHLRAARNRMLQQTIAFAGSLPQHLDFRKEGRKFIITFVRDENPPSHKGNFRKEVLDQYARKAWIKIFSKFDESDLLLLDVCLVFSVLFWNGVELAEMEFHYTANELFELATLHPHR